MIPRSTPPPPPSPPPHFYIYCFAPFAPIVRESQNKLEECLCPALSESLQSLIQMNYKVMA